MWGVALLTHLAIPFFFFQESFKEAGFNRHNDVPGQDVSMCVLRLERDQVHRDTLSFVILFLSLYSHIWKTCTPLAVTCFTLALPGTGLSDFSLPN